MLFPKPSRLKDDLLVLNNQTELQKAEIEEKDKIRMQLEERWVHLDVQFRHSTSAFASLEATAESLKCQVGPFPFLKMIGRQRRCRWQTFWQNRGKFKGDTKV